MTGILIIATGKYHIFVDPLIRSLKKHLAIGPVKYIVFSDRQVTADIHIPIHHEPWPGPTLHRYRTFLASKPLLEEFTYLYYVDADMRAVDTIGPEILGERVAVLHPGFVGKVGTPERRRKSRAFIPYNAKNRYYAGGFQGGHASQFLTMCQTLDEAIREDEENNIIARWHDESHYNAYLYRKPPTVTLDPSYCYPESWSIPYAKRLLALDKDHQAMRS